MRGKSGTPQGQGQTAKKTDKPQDSGALRNRVPPVGQYPPPPPEGHNADGNSNPTPWWKQLKIWQFIGEMMLVVIGIWLACIYSSQLGQMVESNRINRDALQSVQRAFVFMNNVPNVELVGPSNEQKMLFMFHWENSGTTPVRFFDNRINALWQKDPIPDTFGFPDKETQYTGIPAVIGPKQPFYVGTEPIPTIRVQDVLARNSHLYFYGWARYNDVFEGTPRHVTKFCFEVIPAKAAILPNGQVSSSIQVGNCKSHNCYDEECKEP